MSKKKQNSHSALKGKRKPKVEIDPMGLILMRLGSIEAQLDEMEEDLDDVREMQRQFNEKLVGTWGSEEEDADQDLDDLDDEEEYVAIGGNLPSHLRKKGRADKKGRATRLIDQESGEEVVIEDDEDEEETEDSDEPKLLGYAIVRKSRNPTGPKARILQARTLYFVGWLEKPGGRKAVRTAMWSGRAGEAVYYTDGEEAQDLYDNVAEWSKQEDQPEDAFFHEPVLVKLFKTPASDEYHIQDLVNEKKRRR